MASSPRLLPVAFLASASCPAPPRMRAAADPQLAAQAAGWSRHAQERSRAQSRHLNPPHSSPTFANASASSFHRNVAGA
eukprot:818933-Rhodomonas_salina.2